MATDYRIPDGYTTAGIGDIITRDFLVKVRIGPDTWRKSSKPGSPVTEYAYGRLIYIKPVTAGQLDLFHK
jgi:hypothetical protein